MKARGAVYIHKISVFLCVICHVISKCYPPPWRKMTIIIIDFVSATNASLKSLRFNTQAVVGGSNLSCYRRALINQL
jgi:hypothetical protein